jgi:hypothetical protein
MHTPDTEEVMEHLKRTEPKEWLKTMEVAIEQSILKYNVVAEREGADVIVAFRMTKEERDQAMEEAHESSDSNETN